jgi:hypothetical protein
MAEKPKTLVVPKTLGACADALYSTRLERLRVQKEIDALAAHETALKEHIIANLPKSDSTGVAGKLARVSITKKTIPRVADWTKFYTYVAKNKAFELLQKRLGEAAIQERWDAGKPVPGVETFNVVGVSVNKL